MKIISIKITAYFNNDLTVALIFMHEIVEIKLFASLKILILLDEANYYILPRYVSLFCIQKNIWFIKK